MMENEWEETKEIPEEFMEKIKEDAVKYFKELYYLVNVDDETKSIITFLLRDPKHPKWHARTVKAISEGCGLTEEEVKNCVEKYKSQFLTCEEKIISRAMALSISPEMVNLIYELYE